VDLACTAVFFRRGSTPPALPDTATLLPLPPEGNGEQDVLVSGEQEVGQTADLAPGQVTGAGQYAVGNADGEFFAVSRRCRHLGADLANGTIDQEGRLVCPWHQSAYDVRTGQMVRGPQGAFAKVPGLGGAYRLLTRVLPLRRGTVVERDGCLFVR
jgi:nitrite reductase/ring-hydroxylating ferredoxin subunit